MTQGSHVNADEATQKQPKSSGSSGSSSIQSDADWEASFLDFQSSKHPETGKFVMNPARLAWFRQQEIAYRCRQQGAADGLSDERLQKLKSLGFFPQDTSVPPLPVAPAPSVPAPSIVPPPEPVAPTATACTSESPMASKGEDPATEKKQVVVQPSTAESSSPLKEPLATNQIVSGVNNNSHGNTVAQSGSASSSSNESSLKPDTATNASSPAKSVEPVKAAVSVHQLPLLNLSYWVLPEGREMHCCPRYNAPDGCTSKSQCRHIHVQYPWGDDLLLELWSKCTKSLPPQVRMLYLERIQCLSAFADDKFWYTAKYSSDIGEADNVDKKIILSEGGATAHRSAQGISWYPTNEEAKEALEKVVTVTYWATENGVQSHQLTRGATMDGIAKRIADAACTDKDNGKKRSIAEDSAAKPDSQDSSRASKSRCVEADGGEQSRVLVEKIEIRSSRDRDIAQVSGSLSGTTSVYSDLSQKSSKPKKAKHARVDNTNYNTKFISYRSAPKPAAGVQPMIKRHGKGKTMCISYHVRGACWTTCNRSYDHHPHTAAEDDELFLWCTHAFTNK